MDNNLGNIISELRNRKNLTQKELADKLGISDKAVSRWETGKSFPDLDMLFRISKFFKVSFNDLLTARMEDDGTDDELMQDIIKEFNDMNTKHSKRIKIIIIFLIILSIIFTAVIIFTNTYNRFKVYQVYVEGNCFEGVSGVYVETNIKDTFMLDNLKIRDVEIKEDDIVSVDLYYLENKKEHIIQNFSSLDNIIFTNFQSYIKIDDLSKYKDNLYIRITIIDSDNKATKFDGKLEFTLDFSNNKIFIKDDDESLNNSYDSLSVEEIKDILLKNGFEEVEGNILVKNIKNDKIIYNIDANKINYNAEINNLNYQYIFNLNFSILDVNIYDENNIEIEDYEYNAKSEKIINCNIGSCNNYRNIMETLNKEVLYLLKK